MRILRGLTSRLLPCGCIAGIYETYDGQVVALLDERQASCGNRAHRTGTQIPELAVHPGSSDTRHGSRRREP
jgi:hypothetical protein